MPVGTIANRDGGDCTKPLSRARLQKLVKEVDPMLQLSREVEDKLFKMAEDFMDTSLYAACLMAKSKYAPSVEVEDVLIQIERLYNMKILSPREEEKKRRKQASLRRLHT